ncbi:putative ferredoxin/ferredoxin--NADP reductase [Rhodococcus sp. RD6.2]|uniref:4Fe-4S binding protein n=1 Tax=Rhodococcus sp. RD6.2 TaxID=260936 RepID=UPI00063B9D27|nr:4Fe-4S binding protein [Rhodococcus sp. RD6.2]CRK52674.1 putative ferredoxin/ferredoxin--NADP reductase [Rhodococcus sp. RD6.2]
MAFVITQPCCNDASCTEVCPVDCIHPTPDERAFQRTEMLYIDAETCIDCGLCVDACPVNAIFRDDDLPDGMERYASINADYFAAGDHEAVAPGPSLKFPKTDHDPFRVAIIGSGPSGFYAARELLAFKRSGIEVDMFDRLPTPWGLVRAGVAPDHPETKSVTDMFAEVFRRPGFRLHLNVEVGKHITHAELLEHHHAVIYAVGAPSDRRLGIPGEDLDGSLAATEFVAWYNGHPDYAGRTFDLSGRRAVIVGNGNVALDVARLLVVDPDRLAETDMAQHAVDALRGSAVDEVVLLGRRGPAQAAFTNPELLALGYLPGVDIVVDPAELELDAASAAEVESDPAKKLKLEILREYAGRPLAGHPKRIVLRFLASPVEIQGDDRVTGVLVARNEMVADESGAMRARSTDQTELLEAGLVLRSVGYRGVPIPDLPFDDERGTISNVGGRVTETGTDVPVPGTYTAGWIKRGPSGVIGTNRLCAHNTIALILEDLVAERLNAPKGDREALVSLLAERQPDEVDWAGWKLIDAREKELGKAGGRPRVKLLDIGEMVTISKG